MKYIKSFNENISEKSYKYLGEVNSPLWANNLRDIKLTKTIISNKPYTNDINKKHLEEINILFSTLGTNRHVIYADMKDVANCRFGNCWFFYNIRNDKFDYDICVQTFEDEWYLVRYNSASIFSEWYLCDQFEGLKQLVNDKLGVKEEFQQSLIKLS